MTKINIKFIIAVAAIVFVSVLFGLGVLAITKINGLNDEIGYLNSRINQINNNNSGTQNQINDLKNELLQMLEEQDRNYFDVGYKITGINAQNKTAVAIVTFSLKESPISGDVEVSYGKGGQYSSIAATKQVNGKYMVELNLQIDKDYDIGYSVTLSTVKTEKLTEINVMKNLYNRFSADTGFSSINNGNWQLNFSVSNGYFDDSSLKIATGKLEIFKNNTVIKTVDIKNYVSPAGNGYEQYSIKELAVNELTRNDFMNSDIETRITLVDNYGLVYTFGK